MMRFTFVIVAILVATAVALPAQRREDSQAPQVRKSREITVGFGASSFSNDRTFGHSPYQNYPAYQQYYGPYNNYPGPYYGSYGRPYYGGYQGGSESTGYAGIGASIGFGFGSNFANDAFNYQPDYYGGGPYGYGERWRLFG